MTALRVIAVRVPSEERRRLADLIGVPVPGSSPHAPAASAHDRGARMAVVFKGVDAAAFAALLEQRFDLYVEWTDPESTAAILLDDQPSLAISVTPRSAYEALSGSAIAQLLVAHEVLPAARADPVATAVQEAISNAIIHGHLDLHLDADTDFIAFHEEIARRIARPEAASGRITIRSSWTATDLTVSVEDDGNGFIPPGDPCAPRGAAPSGRGFLIMRSHAARIDHQRGGRVTVLTFERIPA